MPNNQNIKGCNNLGVYNRDLCMDYLRKNPDQGFLNFKKISNEMRKQKEYNPTPYLSKFASQESNSPIQSTENEIARRLGMNPRRSTILGGSRHKRKSIRKTKRKRTRKHYYKRT